VFIRLVVGSDGDHHRALTGIIVEARLLRDRGELDQAEEARLETSYDWFEDHLPVPPFGDSNCLVMQWRGSSTTPGNRSGGCGTS
jgi:hypothetical protein